MDKKFLESFWSIIPPFPSAFAARKWPSASLHSKPLRSAPPCVPVRRCHFLEMTKNRLKNLSIYFLSTYPNLAIAIWILRIGGGVPVFNVYSGILKMMDCFRDDKNDVTINYLVDDNYRALCEKYDLFKTAGDKDDFNKIVNLLEWISSNIFHQGNNNNRTENAAIKLFGHSFGKGLENGLNCQSLSLALTECLLAVGVKARTIYIMPFSPYDLDNHVVCEAWVENLDKWIMVDPSYNLYALHEGICLNILELRSLLANQMDISFNDRANYNNTPINKERMTSYYAKNLFRFVISDIQGSDAENMVESKKIDIAPIGYDVKKFKSIKFDYLEREFGDSERWQKWRKDAEENELIYKGADILC